MTITFERYFETRRVFIESLGDMVIVTATGAALNRRGRHEPIEQRHVDLINRFRDQINSFLDGEWTA